MSRFKTAIPVDVDKVKRMLPVGTFFHGVEFDAQAQAVVLTWEHEKVQSPYAFAADFPLGVLLGQQPPPEYVKTVPGLQLAKDTSDTKEQSVPTPTAEAPQAAAPAAEEQPVESVPTAAAAPDSVPTPQKESVATPRRRK